jgi:hypothetical protein
MKTIRMTLLAIFSLFSSVFCFGQNQGNAQPQPMVPNQQLPRAYTLPLPLPTSPDLGKMFPIDSIIQEDMARIQKEVMKGQKRKEKSCEVVKRSKGSITFVVDENLPAPQRDFRAFSGDRVAGWMLKDEGIPQEKHKIVAASFLKDKLIATDKDIFFQCMILSYSDHRPVCISPDMVWMLISQGFARYVNAHPEELRDQLVYHTGKMDLVVESKNDVLSNKVDWEQLLDGFAAQIDKHTKGNIATTLIADFSTTRLAERIASQITLMESVKAYFSYREISLSCGIPTVTLTGTPQDWQRVLDKTRHLKQYGLNEWIQSLEPILQEFVYAAEGNPNQKFWKGMVKKHRVKELYGGGCGSDEPTKLDGWMLKLFPDKDGKTLNHVTKSHHMPTERVRVNFKHIVMEPVQGDTISETDMELMAGFVGVETDSATGAMTPKIGWLVRLADNPE